MASHKQVAEAWANGKKLTGSRMFTDGTTVWSYGLHFPIAHKLNNYKLLFNIDKYSSSTSSHQSRVRNACSHFDDEDIIECTTEEIQRAINHPDEPIVITKYKEYNYLADILEALKNYCKSQGIKRFPMQKIKNQIEKLLVVSRLSK